MVDFTVAIPTYNGEHRLPDVLWCLQMQDSPATLSWEIVIVDNNSQDNTAAVVKAFQAGFSQPLRYCLEPQQGASYARQRAVQEANSELIGFLDDDNLPDANWVTAAYEFAQQHPRAGAFGSYIAPDYKAEPPAQFKRIAPFLAITERGSQPHLYVPEKKMLPPGAGLVVRKQVWLQTVPSHTLLSQLQIKRSDGNDCSEDLEVLLRIQQSGWEVWYNPAMRITHVIPAWRLERSYLLPLFRSIGLSRHATRMVRFKTWQGQFMVVAYFVSDLARLMFHCIRYGRQLRTNLVAACELELYIGIMLSPIYTFSQVLSKPYATKQQQI
jgi:glycosyltransferase involved in cell wall biosynthesis